MRIVYRILPMLRSLFRSRRIDADLEQELQFHIERETEANIARGMTPANALRDARRTVGRVDDVREASRDERPGVSARRTASDLRFGMRLLARSPVFAVAAVTIIALGMASVTTIFSVVYGVMLRPMNFRDPERLVSIWSTRPAPGADHLFPNAADVIEWRASNRSFEDIALARSSAANFNFVGSGEPERLQAGRVSVNLFSVLGVSPALGRAFIDGEDRDGNDRVVILGDALWRRRFGGDSAVIGRKVVLSGAPYTVVGVMGPEFQYPTRDAQAWVPAVFDPRELTRETSQNYRVVARLKPNVTLDAARADLAAVVARLAQAQPATNRDVGVLVESMLRDAVRTVRAPLLALVGAVCCLLLIAALNLSNLLGARAEARRGEFALRLALGASRSRVLAQAVAEVVPVIAIGGVLGIGVAAGALRLFVANAPPSMPRVDSVGLSLPVIIVSLLILAVTGVLASVIPMIRTWRMDFTTLSRDGGRTLTGGRRQAAARRIGVALQIAFAIPMLVGASVLVRSALKVTQVDLGFQPDGVATFHLAVPRSKYGTDAQVADFYSRLAGAVSRIPGVAHTGFVNRLPLAGGQTISSVVEKANGDTVALGSVDSRPVTPDYFAALGITLVSGRLFTERDDANSPAVSIVDDALARQMWPNGDALGKRVRNPGGEWSTVVGIVSRVHNEGVDIEPRPQMYWSYRQVTQDRMVLVVRGAGSPDALIPPVRQAVREIDPEQSLYDVSTMQAVVERSLAQRTLVTTLIAAFGAIALLLAAVGVYGVIAYGVTQRLREFGIRVALGATRGAVARMVVSQGVSTALVGATIGLAVALALSGALSTLVYGVAPHDLASLASAVGAMITVAAIASYIPARRASSVDPAVALRNE
jgi:putative ABC transport system permease protein